MLRSNFLDGAASGDAAGPDSTARNEVVVRAVVVAEAEQAEVVELWALVASSLLADLG
jgi:hypothetical protein